MSELKTTPGGLVLLGGRLCLDFCNTVTERHSAPRDMLAPHQYAAFVYWCTEVGLINQEDAERYSAWQMANPDAAQTLFDRATELREAIYQAGLAAIDQKSASEAVLKKLNRWIQQAMTAREMATTPDGKYEWRWRDQTAPEPPLWEIVLSAIEVLSEEDSTRLRQCPGCGWLFYDHSKNNSRTWCDMRFCGNRAKNKRFHARQKQDQEE